MDRVVTCRARHPRYRAAAWRVLLSVFVAALLADGIMKPLIGRARPQPDETVVTRALPHAPASFSFPSGHAATTVGGMIAVARMWPQGAWSGGSLPC